MEARKATGDRAVPRGGRYEERHPEVGAFDGQVRRIDAGAQVVGDGEGEVGFPAGVEQIVIVEVDCAVLLGCLGPACVAAVPVPARDGAGRLVDDDTVEADRADIVDGIGWNAVAEIPGADQSWYGAGVVEEHADSRAVQGNGGDAGTVDPAVEMSAEIEACPAGGFSRIAAGPSRESKRAGCVAG